jgi:hypothetical protein
VPNPEPGEGLVGGADCGRGLLPGDGDTALGMRRTIGPRFLPRLVASVGVLLMSAAVCVT